MISLIDFKAGVLYTEGVMLGYVGSKACVCVTLLEYERDGYLVANRVGGRATVMSCIVPIVIVVFFIHTSVSFTLTTPPGTRSSGPAGG